MKIRRFLSIVISAILLAYTCIVPTFAKIPSKPDAYYVYDEAGVLSEESENYISSKNAKLSAATDAEIVVAAIKTTGNMPINEFALNMYIDWSIGDSGKLNGVLVLLVIDDDKYWVVQGTGIEDKLTSGKIRTMFDNCLEPYFAAKDYDKGAVGIFDLLIKEFEEIYDVDLNEVKDEERSGIWSVILIILLVIVGIAVVGFIALVIARNISYNKYRSKNYRPGTSIPPQTRRPQNPRNSLPPNQRSPGAALPRPNTGNRPNATPQRQGYAPRPNGTPRPNGNMPRRPGTPMPPRQGTMPRQGGNVQRPNQGNRPPRP